MSPVTPRENKHEGLELILKLVPVHVREVETDTDIDQGSINENPSPRLGHRL